MVKLTPELIVRSTSCTGKKGRDESVLRFFKRITHLYLEGKGLSEVEGDILAPCPNLAVLYLYDNRLTCVPNLHRNENLTQIYLQHNNIQRMEHFNELKKLSKLYLGGNSIATVEGLSSLRSLQELHIENQKLALGEKLTFDPRSMQAIGGSLTVLNISGNAVDSLSDITPLHQLTELSAANNCLSDLPLTTQVIGGLRFLRCLNLAGNPICSGVKYRDQVILSTSTVEKLDGKEVTDTARKFLQNWRTKREAVENQKKSMVRQKTEIVSRLGTVNELSSRGDDPDYADMMMMGPLNAYDGLINNDQPSASMLPIQNSFSLPALPARFMYKVLPCPTTQPGGKYRRSADATALRHTMSLDNNYKQSDPNLMSFAYNRTDIPTNGLRIL